MTQDVPRDGRDDVIASLIDMVLRTRAVFLVTCRSFVGNGAAGDLRRCGRPATHEVTWSDRRREVCADHIGDACNAALTDNSGGRTDNPVVHEMGQHPVLFEPIPGA